jgi:hypothetical protein
MISAALYYKISLYTEFFSFLHIFQSKIMIKINSLLHVHFPYAAASFAVIDSAVISLYFCGPRLSIMITQAARAGEK